MYSNGVGPQVLSTLVTALPLQDNTKYQHGNTKIFRKHQNIFFGKRERERERETARQRERRGRGERERGERDREKKRSALLAWSVLAREGRCRCLVS